MQNMKGQVIVGPTLHDIQALGLHGRSVDIATAFYTRRALESLSISAKQIRLLFRIDLEDIEEWCGGYVAPDALLAKIDSLVAAGAKVDLFGHPEAHVKAYIGNKGALIGSANLTVRGFGGGREMVLLSRGRVGAELVRASLSIYQERLTEINIEELREYVRKNLGVVRKRQQKRQKVADRLPDIPRDKISTSLGSYKSFLIWLKKQSGDGAQETLDRANGKSNLQGHIHRNFYGLRQFFLAYPELQARFANSDASTYKLSKEPTTETQMKAFVRNHAADEDDFSLSTWKTYLPQECGGRAAKHGGTIGNLNRMLPLVAQFLEVRRPRKRV